VKKVLGSLLLLILLSAAGFAFFLWLQGPTYRPSTSAPPEAPPPVAATEPAIRYPIPESADKPLPSLEQSDSTALAALADIFGKNAANKLFVNQEVIRRFVVTVDSLPREVISAQLQPTTRVPGQLRISGKGLTRNLSSANYTRYTPFIRVAEAVDAKTFTSTYIDLYPLFQQAYRDLGYPNGYFNDRLVEVIDHMLEAPEIDGPIALIQPHIFYKFADPKLQSLSAGHKLMLRIGNDNAARVKGKLREIRSELVAHAPKAQ
jgi:hypothetical protein